MNKLFLKLRMKIRQKRMDRVGRALLKAKFNDDKLKFKLEVLLEKQMADRAKLGVQELPHGGFVIWGD